MVTKLRGLDLSAGERGLQVGVADFQEHAGDVAVPGETGRED